MRETNGWPFVVTGKLLHCEHPLQPPESTHTHISIGIPAEAFLGAYFIIGRPGYHPQRPNLVVPPTTPKPSAVSETVFVYIQFETIQRCNFLIGIRPRKGALHLIFNERMRIDQAKLAK